MQVKIIYVSIFELSLLSELLSSILKILYYYIIKIGYSSDLYIPIKLSYLRNIETGTEI